MGKGEGEVGEEKASAGLYWIACVLNGDPELLSPKMTILQGVRHPISYIGVCYVNDRQKRGYVSPRVRLI